MISIGKLSAGRTAADYYLTREAGCELEYYTGTGERPGHWLGPAAAALGLSGALDGSGRHALRALLGGQHPDGTVLAGPVLRADPRGRLPADPLVDAIDAAAARARVATVGRLLADPALAESYAQLSAPGRLSVPATLAGRLATAAGLDPAALYPPRGRAVGYTRALEFDGKQVDVRRAGLDVTISAPKSVSLLWAFADPYVAKQVQSAHRTAVGAVLEYLQGEAGHGLRGHQGNGQRATRIGTDGLLVAAFDHRTSRAGDPQLHTHLVIPNLVHGRDGQWSAVDSRALYRHALTASHVYHLVLRGELTERLGVQWAPVRRGIAEIAGIPPSVRREFSARRRQILDELAQTGRSGPAAAQQACLATRPAKPVAGDTAGLRERWAARLVELGHDAASLTRQAMSRVPPPRPPESAELAQALLADEGLTEKRSAFDRRAVLQGLCQQLPPGTPMGLDAVQRLAGQLLAHPAVVPLLAGQDDERVFSTAGMLATERSALDLALQRQQVAVGMVDRDRVLAAICQSAQDRGRLLSPAQAAAVLALTGSGRGVEVLVGAAGSGKTAAIAAAHAAWTDAGTPVLGTAMAASAARNLQEATGIASSSLTRLLLDLDTARSMGERSLPVGAVLVVDEAGMVGTRELHRLLAHTAAADAKLVLVGDPQQLPEINAGGLFAHLACRLPALSLTDNQRQRNGWERQALDELRAGRTGPALAGYLAHHRIHTGLTAHDLRDRLASDYLRRLERTASPYDVLVITARRADARLANEAIRELLRARGRLGPELTVDDGEQRRGLAVGDLVLVTRNDYSRGVLNGTRAQVTGLDPDTGTIGLRTSEDRPVTVPLRWLSDGRLEHSYAVTCHKAQGLTVEHALVYGTAALTQQAGYVAMSRGRSSNHLYTSLDAAARVDTGRDGRVPGPDDPAALAELARALTHDDRQHLASPRLPVSSTWPPRPRGAHQVDELYRHPARLDDGGLSR